MANWCLNTVRFEADETVIEKLRLFFIEMAEKEILKNQGQLPDFYHATTGYLFEIDWEESGLNYLTKWSPNLPVMVAISGKYGADFQYRYEELNMGIYGLAIYRMGVLHDIHLEPEDFGAFDYDDQIKCYVFEGANYRDDADILEILLQRRVNAHFKTNP